MAEYGDRVSDLQYFQCEEAFQLMNNSDIVYEIYNEIFCNMRHGNIDLFLCGAASTREKTSYRDILRNKLEKNANISILYPEDMFMEMLNRKKYDLLTLEQILASNSDVILIVCESPGSFTELGAFVNNSETVDKVVVMLQTKYKNAKSFITLGPVEYIRKKNKDNVIYFNNHIDEAVVEIKKYLRRWLRKSNNRGKSFGLKDLNLISGQFYFMVLLLYFFQALNAKDLSEFVKELYLRKFEGKKFDIIYSSALKRMFKEGLIKKETFDEKESLYMLTDKGYELSKRLLSYVSLEDRIKKIDKIRLKIMYSQYY